MNLIQLVAPYLGQDDTSIPDVSIKGLVTDNRDVKAGDCFIALAGITSHGKMYIDDAIARGAVAVLLESEIKEFNSSNSLGVRFLYFPTGKSNLIFIIRVLFGGSELVIGTAVV